MFEPEIPQGEIERLRALKRPRELYRYRPLNPAADFDAENLGYLASTLRDGIIYVPRALEFNDPWEAQPRFRVHRNPERAADQLAQFFVERGPWDEVAKGELRRQVIALGMRRVLDDMQWRLGNIIRSSPILCLSERPDDAVMWGHYGNKHTGYALALSTETEPIRAALPVKYVRAYPAIDVSRAFAQFHSYEAALLRKFTAWAYEREWRVVSGPMGAVFDAVPPKDGEQIVGVRVRLPRGTVRAVVIGAEMPLSHRAELRRVVRALAPDVELVECQLAADEFRVLVGESVGGRAVLRPSFMSGR